MALANYTDLKASIADWLGRTDLTAIIPDFITIAEKDIARNLRKKVIRAAFSLTASTNPIPLPATLGELRSVRLDQAPYFHTLDLTTPESLSDGRQTSTGVPVRCAVVGTDLLLDNTPNSTYAAEIIYFEKLVPLTTGSPTNTVLTDSPDIYLYACLKEAEMYLEHDDRNPVWAAKYAKALAEENLAREMAELGGGQKVMRLPVVFG